MLYEEEVFVIENAQQHTQGDGSSGSEGSFDTEWRANGDED